MTTQTKDTDVLKSATEITTPWYSIAWEFIKENKTLSLGIFIFSVIVILALFADLIAPYSFDEKSRNCAGGNTYCRYAPPSSEHWFGTNNIGYDVFSRVVYGSRLALQLSFSATLLALMIGFPMGTISGYYGGKVDRFLNAVADATYSFPSLLLAIAIAILLSAYGNLSVIIAVAGATSIVYAPIYFKITRSQVLQVKNESYIDAARSIGASDFTIIVRYIIPNVFAASLALVPFNMTEAILVNAGLAFLGLGVDSPTADWGFDVFKNKSIAVVRTYPWTIFYPGLFIFLLSFAFALIGDALNDKFNPLVGVNE